MHRHHKVWPIVRASSSRSVASAARAKPRPADDCLPKPPHLSKWSLPPSSPAPCVSETLRQPSSSTLLLQPSSAEAQACGINKWARPPAPHLHKAATKPHSLDGPRSMPPLLTKSSPCMEPNKWGRNIPSDPSKRAPTRLDLSRSHPQARMPLRSDPKLKRDRAPHQDLATVRLRKSPHHQLDHSDTPLTRSRHPLEDLRSPKSLQKASPETRFKTPPSNHMSDGDKRTNSRPNRTSHKQRGTLLSGLQGNEVSDNPQQPVQKAKKKPGVILEKKVSADVYIPSTVSVGTLARLLGVRLEILQQRMRAAGMTEEAEYDHVLTSDYAVLLAEEFGRNPVVNDEAAFDIYPSPPHPNPSTLPSRPPVVTIMGHVDHGKTTLLDNLRSSSVAKGEAGGITQHIGAFSVPVPPTTVNAGGPRSITFLDTPGHAAFSAMRARGAGVTDIVVLVVAADDGIMPQTKEVINLIKKDEGKIGVVVAINKVDKPGINIDNVHKALMAENIQLEVFGGDIPSVEVSGLTGLGLPTLVETLSAISEMQDLRAERDGPIQGYVLESKVHKGLGPVATVLVRRGCLKPGAHIICGLSYAKVRVMNDSTGASVKAAYPGMAITVSGWKTLPNAGDEVLQGTEADVKKAVANRQRKAEIEATLVDVEAINSMRRQERERRELESELGDAKEALSQETEQGPKELRLIIKADVSGSAEAVQGALQGIGNKEAVTRIVSSGVGDISESDVMMAKAIGATIVGFSVSTARTIETLAARNEVPIISSNIIYRLMETVKDRVISLLPVVVETRVTGEAVILQLFDIQLKAKQTKKVAGCRVTNGLVEKGKFARLLRHGTTIHDGTLDTMRILKKDVTEIRKGTECGLCFGTAFGDLQEGDIIQMYEKIEKPGTL